MFSFETPRWKKVEYSRTQIINTGKTIKDGKSGKQKKAEKLILDGADLQIIPEQVFYDMLTDD